TRVFADVPPFSYVRLHGSTWMQTGFFPLAALATLGLDAVARGAARGRIVWIVLAVAAALAWQHPGPLVAAAALLLAAGVPWPAPAAVGLAVVAFLGLAAEAPPRGPAYVPTVAARRAAFAKLARDISSVGVGRARFVALDHTRWGDQFFARWPAAATHEE